MGSANIVQQERKVKRRHLKLQLSGNGIENRMKGKIILFKK